MTKIAVFNQKGGVGKTSSVLNLAAALWRKDFPPLVVDMDPQAHLTQMHPQSIEEVKESLFSYYQDGKPLSELLLDWQHVGQLIPAHKQLIKVDSSFGKGPAILNKFGLGLTALEKAAPQSNVLIDCCPYLGALSLSAIFAADLVIVPIASDFLSLQGAIKVEKTLLALEHVVKKRINRRYLLTRFDRRRGMTFRVHEAAIAAFGDEVLNTVISENAAIAESPNRKLNIFSYQASSTGAKDYHALLEELIVQNLVDLPQCSTTEANV
jgi:chromosome partitioning protein